MGYLRSERVRVLTQCVRAVAEADAHGRDARGILISKLAELIGAPVGILVEDPFFLPNASGPLTFASGVNTEPLLPAVGEVLKNRSWNPHFAALMNGRAGSWVVRGRRECVEDRVWQRSDLVDSHLRPSRLADALAGIRALNGRGHVLGFNLLREGGERAFDDEDRELATLFLDATLDLVVKAPPAKRWGLTAREAEVLDGLLDGLTNKELSARLSRSIRTVEVHVARVLKKAGVSSRLKLPLAAASVSNWGKR